jgi:GNAT superfamily N-acetyltransferase
VKVARLAVATRFREAYTGLGTLLIRFAFDLARAHTVEIGCRLLTVDAYRTSVGFYERLGFVRNKRTRDTASGETESDTISMRLDLASTPDWVSAT